MNLKTNLAYWYPLLILMLLYALGFTAFLSLSLFNISTRMELRTWTYTLLGGGIIVSSAILTMSLAFLEFYIFQSWQKMPSGLYLLFKYVTLFCFVALGAFATYYVCDNFFIGGSRPDGYITSLLTGRDFHEYFTFLFLLTVLLDIILALSAYIGPHAALNSVFGKHYQPTEQDLCFMVIDLQSSTTIAEELGNTRYSHFISKCFNLLTESIYECDASIYQFVGDEAVLFWPAEDARNNLAPLKLFYYFKSRLENTSQKFIEEFGMAPRFRAAVHSGIVTVTEIRSFKTEVVYHGDVLNTCARIKDLCSRIDAELLVSSVVGNWVNGATPYATTDLGSQRLKGRSENLSVFQVSRTD
nr:adenylate/guanylate cyclase domain-containing protein [uncultured Dyadobacter sp.]